MNKFLMKCGHVSNAKLMPNSKQYCAICDCDKIAKVVNNHDDLLKGRFAICIQHINSEVIPIPSDWNLPFFEYKPNENYDTYYCGCWGWD